MGSPLVFLIVIATSVWVYFDATGNHIGEQPNDKRFFNMSAGGWACVCAGVWIIGFPAYLKKRKALIELSIKKPVFEPNRTMRRTIVTAFAVLIAGVRIAVAIIQSPPASEDVAAQPVVESAEPVRLCNQSTWDGSVNGVETYLKSTLNDPEFEGVEWSAVVEQLDGDGYAVRFKYRAKNEFGAWMLQNQVFYLDKECRVIFVEGYEPK